MKHHYPNKKDSGVSSEVRSMANKANDNQDQVEQTQGGAEQPQTQETVVTPAETAPAPQMAVTTVPETKQTPSVIAQTNQAKAAELRALHQAALDNIGNNMSAKIRYLADAGLSKGDISRVLQIQFQFVRNVVFNYDMKKAKEAQDAAAAAAKAGAPAS